MQYYQVPEKLKGKFVYKPKGGIFTFVENELLTAKECLRYGIPTRVLQPVEVSRKKIYWFFGTRFELKKA